MLEESVQAPVTNMENFVAVDLSVAGIIVGGMILQLTV